MKPWIVVGLATTLLALAAPALAQPVDAEHITHEPGATLLLPYFEAQVPKKVGGKAPGIDTLFSVNNASATAALAHVTIWTDLAVPVLGFNVYLTGYDVQPIGIVDLLNGKLPVTADAFDDANDTVSPHGPVSQDINFPGGMDGQPAQLDADTIAHLRAALTGKASPLLGGLCAGRDYGEKKPTARGYVTVDSMIQHTTRLPNVVEYFTEDMYQTTSNILWGDAFFVNKSKKVGRGDSLVAIRNSIDDPQVTTVFEYSFYDTVNQNLGPVDKRQPLGSLWAGPFVNVPKHKYFPSGTSAVAWRDPKQAQAAFPCGTTPSWFPLGQRALVAFDEQENPEIVAALPFPAATQLVKVGGPSMPVSAQSGWLYMDLNFTGTGLPVEDSGAAQSFVSMVLESKGKFSIGVRGTVFDDAAEVNHPDLPPFDQ